ncbi:type 2 isopentenyl-diphosphate Delta-isomerase [Aerococcaceae bacterium DSM 111020]|nr:type 2 isopentenyl-diphosphate Delta-isomerase [Aerococcaceae bacterium DSM 111020]
MTLSQDPNLARQRKDDHARLALDQQTEAKVSPFDEVRFIHHSFNQTNYDRIDLSTKWANHKHAVPFYINGMTGGSDFTKQYNEKLSLVAAATGLPIATGSMSIALKDPNVIDSFTIMRQNNPDGFVMTNLGAHHSLENAKRVIDMIQADALQIHVNIPQEVVMPEGDRDYSMWLKNIEAMVQELDIPVIVKEVGFGMSRKTIQQLIDIGVENIDVSGRGGTNFVTIENDRRTKLDLSALSNWGQTTPESLIAAAPYQQQVNLLASGCITDFTHIVKAIAMGAQAAGMSGKMLHFVNELGVDQTIELIESWKEAIQLMMLLLGVETISELQEVDWYATGNLNTFANNYSTK